MRLYVESNFALEFARQQEESSHVGTLLGLAERQQISLAIPVFALSEPVSTLTRYRADRARFLDALQGQVREFERSAPSQGLASILSPLVPEIARIARDEMDRLEAVTARLLAIAEALPTSARVFEDARSLGRHLGLELADSIVLAAVLLDAGSRTNSEKRCFVSRNARDFGVPEIRSRLEAVGCRYISRFSDGLAFVRHCLSNESTSPPSA